MTRGILKLFVSWALLMLIFDGGIYQFSVTWAHIPGTEASSHFLTNRNELRTAVHPEGGKCVYNETLCKLLTTGVGFNQLCHIGLKCLWGLGFLIHMDFSEVYHRYSLDFIFFTLYDFMMLNDAFIYVTVGWCKLVCALFFILIL